MITATGDGDERTEVYEDDGDELEYRDDGDSYLDDDEQPGETDERYLPDDDQDEVDTAEDEPE